MDETNEDESKPSNRTRFRLAKIKSVENMKLMTQSLSTKGSSLNNSLNKRKDKNGVKTDDELSMTSKGDNEDEIAELMLACTTIKKNTASRKKSKQARELENLKRLAEAESNINQDDRIIKFAVSYLQKLNDTLKVRDPEVLKSVLKLLSDSSIKLENFTHLENDDCSLIETVCTVNSSQKNHVQEIKNEDKDRIAIDLYWKVTKLLNKYPDLSSDFLLFLTPYQAALIDKFEEHTMMLKMSEFVNIAQIYFTKQPSRLSKLMQAFIEMVSDPYITVESAQNIMGVVLKGHPLIMDMFLQVLPNGKPPDCLFSPNMYENLSCPVGPHDKNKPYDSDAPELFENIELPNSVPQDDPYGGDSCRCECHSFVEDIKLKGNSDHCAACGTKFLNGRIYLQTSEGLRPAKITFSGEEDEKLENIARVSLKTNEKCIPAPPPKRKRRSSKHDSTIEDHSIKPYNIKNSPTKENDEIISKSKRGNKSPPKSAEQKKFNRSPQLNLIKSKRDKKFEKKEIKNEHRVDDELNDSNKNIEPLSEPDKYVENLNNSDYSFHIDLSEKQEDEIFNNKDSENNINENNIIYPIRVDLSSDSENSMNLIIDNPWTKEEDKVLLENVQKNYCEETFSIVSNLLKDRSVQQVKERMEYLLSLIEKMT